MTHHNPERPGPPPSADEGVVLYEKRDRIAYVTINRPEARNAVSPEVHRAMIAAWADFAEDDSVDVAILTGAGDAFCAGRRPEGVHPADHRRAEARRPPADRGARPERLHPRHAPHLQADHRRDQRLGARRRPGDGARLRHPDRLRPSDVRLLRGPARLPPRRWRHRPPGQHLRHRHRAGDAAHRGADRRRAGAAVQPRLEGGPARPPDGGSGDRGAADPAELAARRPLSEADDPGHGRQDARRAAPGRGLERLHLRGPRGDHAAARRLLREDATRGAAGAHPTDL